VIYEDFADNGSCPGSTGIVMRACLEILQAKKDLAVRGIQLTISAQFVEIYEEQVTDLLSATEGR
jgi:Kinesin motor domain